MLRIRNWNFFKSLPLLIKLNFVTAFNPFPVSHLSHFLHPFRKIEHLPDVCDQRLFSQIKTKVNDEKILCIRSVSPKPKPASCLCYFSIRVEQQQQQTNVKANSDKQKCVVNANQNVKVRIIQTGREWERERASEFECDLRKPTKRTASEMKKSNQAANAANRMKANRI